MSEGNSTSNAMAAAKPATSRKPWAVKRAIAFLKSQGKSNAAVARELGIDRETVTRNLSDPVTLAEIHKLELPESLERSGPAPQTVPGTTSAAANSPKASQTTPARQPVDEYLIRSEHSRKWRCTMDCSCDEVLAALGRTREQDDAIRAARTAAEQPPPAEQNSTVRPKHPMSSERFQELVELSNGSGRRSGSGRRTVSSVSPWLRPMPKLDFWDD